MRVFTRSLARFAILAAVLVGAWTVAQAAPNYDPPDGGAAGKPDDKSPAGAPNVKPETPQTPLTPAPDIPREGNRGPADDNRNAPADNTPRDPQATPDNTRTPREQTPPARDTGTQRDADRDATRDPQRDATRDLNRDATRDTTRDTTRDRDLNREGRDSFRSSTDQWRDRMRDERGNYRWQNFRGADIGLWFNVGGDGLVIADIGTTWAIARFGFHEGDRIVSVNGRRVVREADFINVLFAPEFRDRRVTVIVLRDGREETIVVEPRLIVEEFATVHHDSLDRYGLIIDERVTDRVVVVRVLPYSPAYYAGLRAGDVIVSVRGERIRGPKELVAYLERAGSGSLAVEINRNDRTRSLALDLGARVEQRTALKPTIDDDPTPTIDRRQDRLDIREDRRDDRRDDRGAVVPRADADVDASPDGTRVEVDTAPTYQYQRRYYFRPWRSR